MKTVYWMLLACFSANAPSQSTDAVVSPAIHRLMNTLDVDGDARLSPKEWKALSHPGLSLAEVDESQDGYVDVAELEQIVLSRSPLSPRHQGTKAPRH